MEEWKEIKVGDIGRVITGKTPKTSNSTYYGGNIPFLTPSDDMSVKYVRDTKKHITEEGRNSVKNATLPANAICVSCIGSDLGKVVITTKETVTNQQINSIIVDETKFDVDYIYYAMIELGKVLNFHSKTSTAVPIVNKSSFSQYAILCPPLNVQKKIGTLLSSIDRKIEANEDINNNLEQQMSALYKSWFVDYTPFDGIKPETWIESDIYSISNIIYGAPFKSKLFNTEKIGKPIIRIRDLKEQAFVTYTTEEHPKGYSLQYGDIVVGMDGEFRPYIWGNEEAWLNQRVCVFNNKRQKGKAFLLYTLKPLLNHIEQTQVATTVIHIGKKDFDAFKLYLPDNKVLDEFDEITSPMIWQIVNNSLENKRLAILRDSLLPKLMSGEIDVSEITI
ncbi:MAG: restriction endonuclease subunit S [Roseburia hominis]